LIFESTCVCEACFELGFGVAKWFNLIVAITGLHKTQVSNWVRQRRYHLRKLGQFPPVPQTVAGGGRKWNRKILRHTEEKENDLYFPLPIAQTRKRRRPHGMSGEPRPKRANPLMLSSKERPQPGTFQKLNFFTTQPHVKSETLSHVVQIHMINCRQEAWGLRFGFDEMISQFVVTRVDLGLQAHEKGIQIGWRLKSVNNLDASRQNRSIVESVVAEKTSCNMHLNFFR